MPVGTLTECSPLAFRRSSIGSQTFGPSGEKALELFMNRIQPVAFHSATTLQETRNINVETDYKTQ